MSRKSRKRIEYIADWLISDAEVNGWFWPERLKHRARKAANRLRPRAGRGPTKRLRWRVGQLILNRNSHELPF